MKSVLAMVLAGGRGKRMDILCQRRPKPVLPFAGNFRVIDFSLSNCIHSGINNMGVLVDYQRSHMAKYLNQLHFLNVGSGGFHILEPKAGSYEGTADAVYQNLGYISPPRVETERVPLLPIELGLETGPDGGACFTVAP